jgi:hypothetical protein
LQRAQHQPVVHGVAQVLAALHWLRGFSGQRGAVGQARWYSARRSAPVSCILMLMAECSFSQMRGTPRNMVGATSRRSSCTVRMDSPKFTCEPR